MVKLTLFWFRRDLRLHDNHGLSRALSDTSQGLGIGKVQPIFIFDSNILSQLKNSQDLRVQFIHEQLGEMKFTLQKHGIHFRTFFGPPADVFAKLLKENQIEAVYTNEDYEPYARERDDEVGKILKSNGVSFKKFKDQVIFEKAEVVKDNGQPYSVFTPYKNKWLSLLTKASLARHAVKLESPYWHRSRSEKMISLKELGFETQEFKFPQAPVLPSVIKNYAKTRDFPGESSGTSQLGLHLRFGTVSVRDLVEMSKKLSPIWLSELIWREFFMQILWHYPQVVKKSFRPIYDKIAWRKSKVDFTKWAEGKTGYALVDAGMRQLNQTGYMHNRVRMVTASFLTKHLLIHWSEGEKYFASKLLDYDLASNNGNWQWVAGSGCDAAPYFRIFNPAAQVKKFDPDEVYIRRWVPEFGTSKYPLPMVGHAESRGRALFDFLFKT